MNRIYISGNYIIVERDGIISEYSMGNTIYTIKDDAFIVRESEFGQMVIPYTEIDNNEWGDESYNVLNQSDVLTFLRSNTGFKLPLNGGGGNPINYSTVAFVDNINGNDGTAVIGRFDLPFFSIESALNAVSNTAPTLTNRALVWVRKGDFSSVTVNTYNNVDVHCDAGVVFSGYFSLSDQFVGATNFNWYGNAKWILSMGSVAFRFQNGSTVSINGDSFVNTSAICLAYNVTVGMLNITFNFDSMESTQTIGTGYGFTWRNNCNATLNVKNYIKVNQESHDIRANHSGNIVINCPNNVMTALNVYGGNFKNILSSSNSSATSFFTINGDLYNESLNYGGAQSMVLIWSGSQCQVRINGNIYSNNCIGTWNESVGKIIVNGSMFSNIECFINNSGGDSFFRNGIMVLKNVISAVRLGLVSGTGKVWFQNMTLKNEMVIGDVISQQSNTSQIRAINTISDGADSTAYFINGTVAGTINSFINCQSNLPLNANVTAESGGLVVDTFTKSPNF
jgi:hypothetical protein